MGRGETAHWRRGEGDQSIPRALMETPNLGGDGSADGGIDPSLDGGGGGDDDFPIGGGGDSPDGGHSPDAGSILKA